MKRVKKNDLMLIEGKAPLKCHITESAINSKDSSNYLLKNIMKAISKTLSLFILSSAIWFTGCQDNTVKPTIPVPTPVLNFLTEVNSNPLTIAGKPITDSWRVVHKKYHYHDGTDSNGNDIIKDLDLTMATNPLPANSDFGNDYRENWILGKDSVMFIYNGSLKDGKSFTNAFSEFKMHLNIPADQNSSTVLTIDYVYDSGSKTYSTPWIVTFNSDDEIVFTVQDQATDYFYQYTLHKENLLIH